MNRASLALGLLLGTVAVALVAAGVARDLERAELRGTSATVVAEVRKPQPVQAAKVVPSSKTAASKVVAAKVAPLATRVAASKAAIVRPAAVVVLNSQQYRPLPADPRALLPLTSHTIQVDVKAWMKQFVANPKLEARKVAPPPRRVILDRRELVTLLAAVMTGDISTVDRLIRENDGIDDLRDAPSVPYGHVVVGGRLVALQHRSVDGDNVLAWTGGLHYGQNVRDTLHHRDPTSSLIAAKSERMPGEKLRLWSDDRRAAVDAITNTIRNAGRGTVILAKQVSAVVTVGQWANNQFAAGLDRVAVHVKREAWLATLPQPATQAPVQSAQRPNGGKG